MSHRWKGFIKWVITGNALSAKRENGSGGLFRLTYGENPLVLSSISYPQGALSEDLLVGP